MTNTETSSPTISGCIFRDNLATEYYGGGMWNDVSSPTISNCIFSSNRAKELGGGMRNSDNSNMSVRGCVFWGNSAEYGGGMYNQYNSMVLRNCILWGDTASNGNEIYNAYSSTTNIFYSDIADSGGSGGGWDVSLGTDGGGNIDVDPLFADAVGGDFHLKSEAGRFNSFLMGSLWIEDGETSLCIDAGDPAGDFGYEPAGNGGRINMGVYGGTNQASRSSNIPGDNNGDGRVDLLDLAILSAHWLAGVDG
ncbi:MAG: hypothetical protein GY869_15075 [Planctomycetes bacterium]|nr:hypothetical protein [Planctomycetota bacterium]